MSDEYFDMLVFRVVDGVVVCWYILAIVVVAAAAAGVCALSLPFGAVRFLSSKWRTTMNTPVNKIKKAPRKARACADCKICPLHQSARPVHVPSCTTCLQKPRGPFRANPEKLYARSTDELNRFFDSGVCPDCGAQFEGSVNANEARLRLRRNIGYARAERARLERARERRAGN